MIEVVDYQEFMQLNRLIVPSDTIMDKEIYNERSPKDRLILLGIGYFLAFLEHRSEMKKLPYWNRRSWTDRLRLLLIGFYVYERPKKFKF